MGRLAWRPKIEAIIEFGLPQYDDFKIFTSAVDDEKRVNFSISLVNYNLSFSVYVNMKNPVEVELLEEFKTLCRKTVKFTYYEHGPNWVDKLLELADEVKGEKKKIDIAKKSSFVTASFGEKKESNT